MRIALLSYEYPPDTGFGGIGTYTYYHARALARLGHDVHVFAGSTTARRTTERDGNVTVTRFRKFGPVERMIPTAAKLGLWWFQNRLQTATSMFAALRRELQEGGFDVIEMPECGGEGAWINHLLDLPTVVRFHSPAELIMPTYDQKRLDQLLTSMVERLGISGAKALSSCSHWLAEEVRSRMGIDRPIAVIPNGIDLSLFDQDEGIDIHERFGVPRDRIKVFFANRLETRKGIHVVRDLLVDTLERHPDACFVIAGADPDEIVPNQLRPMLRERDLEHGLCYTGKLELSEVRACLKQSDVFLLTSVWENAPYSLLEAMSAGRAIVASDCGGVPEMVRHEIDGLIARTNDVDSFRRSLDRLLDHDSLRRRFGESARQRVEARFTDQVVALRSLDFYRWALDAPGGTAGSTVSATAAEPRLLVGPDNWFQVWWLRGATTGERPVLPAASDDVPGLHHATLEQLSFVYCILSRTYWDVCGRGGTPEAAFLDDLESLHRARAAALRANAETAPPPRLALPALSHPVFANEVDAHRFLNELWRLGDSHDIADWMTRETTAVGFAERATRRVSWRRVALEAARRRPSPETYATLHAIYRTVAHHARVVQADQEFITGDPRGEAFGRATSSLGLHAPLQRPAVFGRRRKKRQVAQSDREITVLIPSYCHERYIESTIRSVLAQTHERLNVLVVDDGSPDDTVSVARGIDDPRIEVRVNDHNLGLGASVAAALESIESPFVALLNSDDLFHPERLERCLAALEADDSAELVASRVAMMDGKGKRLTTDNACAVDIGARAFGWIRWYASVTASLAPKVEWAALPALLRHNHLATSSNIVCRTDFLRRHANAFPGLKYCLDWWLFSMAAAEGQLLVLPDELVGYRLHDANTVWFDQGGQEDYIHEVNHVVASVLAALAARRRSEGADDGAVAEELAELLQEHVARHGETDGVELALSMLAGRFGEGGDACLRLARAALESKHRARALGEVTAQPWEIARAVAEAPARRVDAQAAELFAHRIRELERELARPRDEAREPGDAEAMRRRLDELRAEFDADLLRARETIADRERKLEHELGLHAATASRLTATAVELEQSRAEGARLNDLLANTERDRDRLQARLDDSLTWARLTELQHRQKLAQLRETHEWRAGRLVLHKLKLNGVFKTALRVHAHARVRGDRALARLRRTARGQPPCAVLFCSGPFPSADEGLLAAEARLLRQAGANPRILCQGVGAREQLPLADRAVLTARSTLVADRSLTRSDRRWFERHRPEAARRVLERLDGFDHLHVVFTMARSAAAHGAGYVHGSGLGLAAFGAWATGVLLGVPFGITVTGRGFRRHRSDAPFDLLREAALLCADSAATAHAIGEATGEAAGSLLVRPPPVFADSIPNGTAPSDSRLFGVVGPVANPSALLVLADAVRAAADRGIDLHVELLGESVLTPANLQAFGWLHGRIRELDVAGHFHFGGPPDPARVADLVARATAIIEPSEAGLPGALSVSVVTACSSGRPIIGFAGLMDGAIRDETEGRVLAPGDADALANAMIEFATSPERTRALGAAARVRYESTLAPEVAAGEFCRRVRELLDTHRVEG